MRKFISIILISIILLSCSKDDEKVKTQSLHPPEWLLGFWSQIDWEEQGYLTGYTFESDNVQLIIDGNISEEFKNYGGNPIDQHTFELNELIISDDRYELTKKHTGPGGILSFRSYKWIKEDVNLLRHENNIADASPSVLPIVTYYSRN